MRKMGLTRSCANNFPEEEHKRFPEFILIGLIFIKHSLDTLQFKTVDAEIHKGS